ncbi:serine/threonine-protein kinase [Streptomyces sp. NPDC093568]|uniref:serine/threonine-protein kinase n=1 Tax=Streptomyces sp. NPDC093568 TaxID=3366041 RepID=UPI003819ED76
MGRVWRAVDEILDRLVAVKEMRIDGLDPEDTRTRRERTLREARATARIDHPNVVRVYDVVDEGERLWIVMELVAGRSLERIMAEEGPLGPCETARIGVGLVAALRQVHDRGVLHRDIKPGNVLVESETARGRGRIVLTDFGIAAIQDAKALTMVGMLVGSPDYMAPERISGRPQGPPSDIWSLGATLSAALAGRSPFSRDTTLATLHAVLYEEPELPPTAGPLRDILAALLDKDPALRPGLDDVESALRTVADPVPTPTMPVLGGGEAPPATPEPEPVPESRSVPEQKQEPESHSSAESPTPALLDASRIPPRPPDPRQPEDIRDAIPPQPLPPTKDLGTEEPRTEGPRHDVVGPVTPTPTPTPAPTPEEEAAPRPLNASTEHTAPESRAETHSATPSGNSSGPAPRRAGVSLSRAEAVTERRPGPGTEPVPGGSREYGGMPPGELPGPAVPAHPRPPRRGHRRTGVVAAVGIVAAGAVVAVVLASDFGAPKDSRAGSSPSASSVASAPSTSPSSTVEGTSRPQSLPPGARREAGGFAWAPPEGWRRDVKTGSEVHYTSPDAAQELAAKSSLARDDLMDSWQKSEQDARQGKDYVKIRLERTTFRGHPAVVWEYTFSLQGDPWHAQLLGFTVDGKTYQINTWYRPDVEEQAVKTYEKVRDGFTVL